MGTTPERIGEWFDEGVTRGATHMIVVCDTWDHDDSPHYVMAGEDPREVAAVLAKEQYTRIMEVYALHLPKHVQLNQPRSFHYERPGEPMKTASTHMTGAAVDVGYPDPTQDDQNSRAFEALWQAIKEWDIERDPRGKSGRAGASGNDVMHIIQTLEVHGMTVVRRPREHAALVAMRKGDVQEMIGELGKYGMTMPYLERALLLPQGTLRTWRTGDCPADGLTLLKILCTFPWVVKVAEAQFDPFVANTEFAKEENAVSNKQTRELAAALMKGGLGDPERT